MTTPVTTDRDELAVVRAALGHGYEILDVLGRGGMAIVYRARERQLDREVAIKVLPFTLAFDADLVERFQREARLSAQLEHPHIVPIYQVGRSGDVSYFVMQLLRGQSLSARLSQRGRLAASDVRRILTETASALGHAHKRGIVHRDVKPDNIMLDDDGRCVITDFGIARSAADSKLTAAGMSIGTPRYMSPEQARAREVDGRSDLYSLGIVGYECLAGRVPFDEGDPFAILMHHVQSPVPPPLLARDDADARRVYAVIERLLAKTPEERFQSADEMIAALESGVLPAPSAATVVAGAGRPDLAGRSPDSSAALDSALDAGIELLRQQRPRVQAGIALLGAVAEQADGAWIRLQDIAGPPLSHSARWLGNRGARVWKRAGVAAVGCTLAVVLGRYAMLQRSRCPEARPDDGRTDDSAATAALPARFDVRVDALGRRAQGRDLIVYYDVCGLEAGSVQTRIVVTKRESGLKRLFSPVEPVVASYDDEIDGPRSRRRRSIAFDGMPSGSYVLDLVVHDSKGRRRAASSGLQLGGQ